MESIIPESLRALTRWPKKKKTKKNKKKKTKKNKKKKKIIIIGLFKLLKRTKNDQFFKNSLTLQERNHSKEMVLLNCKKVHPDHDNIRYTDLKAPMGFEPMTSGLLDRRSNHLSYGAMLRLCV